jgi:hypothetical protein
MFLVAPKSPKKRNPFYPLLVVVGLVFAITACGFAVMTVRGINPSNEFDPAIQGGLIPFFQEYGFTALMIELAVLALATFGAIATDEMWADRTDRPGTDVAREQPEPGDTNENQQR